MIKWCVWAPLSELRSVTCRTASHSVTCHPTQVNAPNLNPSQADWCSIYLSQRDERLSRAGQLVIYVHGLPVCRQSAIEVVATW